MVLSRIGFGRYAIALTFIIYATITPAAVKHYDFKLYKLQGEQPGPTLLIIGGIQGDEPGGFTAATLIATNYHIKKGNVWVVPNLNFASILYRSRGLYGDMNRKFLHISKNDPDYQIVNQIKKLITDKQVDVILNLHDGSGFFSPAYIDQQHNPRRWGQTVIIDQEEIDAEKFTRLGDISRRVTQRANVTLPEHSHYSVKNTRTRDGDAEMEKSLTYFAIRHGKSAFGIEASKSFSTEERAYYHLHVIESFMSDMGLGYARDFKLNSANIRRVMYHSVDVSLYGGMFYLLGNNLKKSIYYVPMRANGEIEYQSKNPLVALLKVDKHYQVKFGNRHLSTLYPQFFALENSLHSITMMVDGREVQAKMGSVVDVTQDFLVKDVPGYRVNVIGAKIPGRISEVESEIDKSMLPYRFSIDRAGNLFRVEFYHDKNYCGMILIRFI